MEMKTISTKVGEPSNIIEVGKEIFIKIPYLQIYKMPTGKLKDETVIIGISENNGKDWKFVTGANKENFGQMLPKAVELIQLPDKKSQQRIETN